MKNILKDAIDIMNDEQKEQDDLYELSETSFCNETEEEKSFMDYKLNNFFQEMKKYAKIDNLSDIDLNTKSVDEKILIASIMIEKMLNFLKKEDSLSEREKLRQSLSITFLEYADALFQKNIPEKIYDLLGLSTPEKIYTIKHNNDKEYIYWDINSFIILFTKNPYRFSIVFSTLSSIENNVFERIYEHKGVIQWKFKKEYEVLNACDVKDFCDELIPLEVKASEDYYVADFDLADKTNSFFRNKLLSLKLKSLPCQAEINKKRKI